MPRKRRLCVLLIVSSVLACREEQAWRSVEDEPAPPPSATPDESAKLAPSSSANESAAESTIEQILIAFTKRSGKLVSVRPTAVPSIKCIRLILDGATIKEGDLLSALANTGLRIELTDDKIAIRGRARSLGQCAEDELDGYAIQQGKVSFEPSSSKPRRGPKRRLLPSTLGHAAAVQGIKMLTPTSVELSPEGRDLLVTESATYMGRKWRKGIIVPDIEPDSLAAKAGLKKGDVVLTLNGFKVDDPDAAIEAYAKIRNAAKADLAIERDGKRVTIQYVVK